MKNLRFNYRFKKFSIYSFINYLFVSYGKYSYANLFYWMLADNELDYAKYTFEQNLKGIDFEV